MLKGLLLCYILMATLFFVPQVHLFGIRIALDYIIIVATCIPIAYKWYDSLYWIIGSVSILSSSVYFIAYPLYLLIGAGALGVPAYYSHTWLVDYLGVVILSVMYYIFKQTTSIGKEHAFILVYCPGLVETRYFLQNNQQQHLQFATLKKWQKIVICITFVCIMTAWLSLFIFANPKYYSQSLSRSILSNFWYNEEVAQLQYPDSNDIPYYILVINCVCILVMNHARYCKIILQMTSLAWYYKVICLFIIFSLASTCLCMSVFSAIILDFHL